MVDSDFIDQWQVMSYMINTTLLQPLLSNKFPTNNFRISRHERLGQFKNTAVLVWIRCHMTQGNIASHSVAMTLTLLYAPI